MSSSDGRRRADGKSAVAAEPTIAAGSAAGTGGDAAAGSEAADSEQRDPWFEPGPKLPGYAVAGPASDDRESSTADLGSITAEWFLPTGRAGLRPDSMTLDLDDDDESSTSSGPVRQQRADATGAPPWAGEVTGPAPQTPPPWETGPWPGPGEYRGARAGDESGSADPAGARGRNEPWSGPYRSGQYWAGQHAAGQPGAVRAGAGPHGRTRGQAGPPPPGGRRAPPVILAAGLLPLVIPGLVLGTLGLRGSAAGGPVRRAGVTAVSASLAWAVIIIVIVVVSTSGSSAASCTYPAAVHRAYARVMSDLDGSAPVSVQAADLGVAVSRANASAAAAGQIPVRSALFVMAGDLEQARADAAAGRAVPADLRRHLAADGAALTRACPS